MTNPLKVHSFRTVVHDGVDWRVSILFDTDTTRPVLRRKTSVAPISISIDGKTYTADPADDLFVNAYSAYNLHIPSDYHIAVLDVPRITGTKIINLLRQPRDNKGDFIIDAEQYELVALERNESRRNPTLIYPRNDDNTLFMIGEVKIRVVRNEIGFTILQSSQDLAPTQWMGTPSIEHLWLKVTQA